MLVGSLATLNARASDAVLLVECDVSAAVGDGPTKEDCVEVCPLFAAAVEVADDGFRVEDLDSVGVLESAIGMMV